jgi:hypothetical protein
MNGKELNNEDRSDQKQMKAFLLSGLFGPGDEFVHFAGRIERRGRFKDDTDLFAIGAERDNVVSKFLVSVAMALILAAVTEQGEVKLADMVLGQAHVFIRLEHEIHRLGIAGDLLLVARLEGLHPDVGEQCLDLGIRELGAFNTRAGANALDGRHAAQSQKAVRR